MRFRDVVIPGVGEARLAPLQPWQLHRLQFELRFGGVANVGQFDARRCARLVQVVAVPTDSAVLLFPGGQGLEDLQRHCTEDQLRELVAVICEQNGVFDDAQKSRGADIGTAAYYGDSGDRLGGRGSAGQTAPAGTGGTTGADS